MTTVFPTNTTWSNNTIQNVGGTAKDYCSLDLTKAELPVLLLFTLMFNSVALIILFKIRSTCQGVDYLMVVSLAVNDFVTTLIFTIMWIAAWKTCSDTINFYLCSILGWFATTMVIFSAWVVIIMAGCRYLATVKPLYYRTNVTNFTVSVGLFVTLLWTLAQLTFPFVGLAAPYMYYDENKICAYDFSPGKGSFSHRIILGVLSCEGLLATCVILYFNFSIIFELRRNNKIQSEMSNQSRINGTKSNYKHKRTAFANVTKVVSAVYCLCYGPFLVRLLYDVIDNTHEQDEFRHSITMTLLFMSPLLNPLVYVACNRRYREYIVLCFKRLIAKCKRQERSLNSTDIMSTATGQDLTLSTRA